MQAISTSNDPDINQKSDQQRNMISLLEGQDSDEEKENSNSTDALGGLTRGLKRPRTSSFRADKLNNKAYISPEISELERRVIEVLQTYSNGASSLRVAKLGSEQTPSIKLEMQS